MITIKKKEDCCGCYACVQICPKRCISMQEDNEGFQYPIVDTKTCIKCKKCLQVCPVLNQREKGSPLKVFAVKNKNEKERLTSASGGFFQILSKKIIETNGIVFGAKFDKNWQVIHDFTNSTEGILSFQSSKYVQSQINDNFLKVKKFLQQGKNVLFSGTPCQIHGLKLFLGKDYQNLYTAEIVCYGVPSPKVWRLYLREIIKQYLKINPQGPLNKYIRAINFRTKNKKWKSYKFSLSFFNKKKEILETPLKNIYMKGFFSGLFIRPSCHVCPSKNFKSNSDFTLGDFWGIDTIIPEFYDQKGISLVLINSIKGIILFNTLENIEFIEARYEEAFQNNKRIERSISLNNKRYLFFEKLKSNGVIKTIQELTYKPIFQRLFEKNAYYYSACKRKIKKHLLTKVIK